MTNTIKITANHPLSKSADQVQENLEKIKSLFPTIVKEGKIDVEELQALLGEEIENNEEYYRFTWAGKSMARQEANKPSTGTLRPVPSESVKRNGEKYKDKETFSSSRNFGRLGEALGEASDNIFIEGDNLEVLKLLQKSYANKIKMIYIDPPYNTGKDFVYKDNYADNLGNYLSITGQTDEAGKKLSTNTETDGRYHSNWLNMMYPRLKLARNLLKEDGVIFISIDDNEVANLRKVCDEIFGEENFVADISVVNNLKGRNDKRYIATANERLLMYVKTDLYNECGLKLPELRINEFNKEDVLGKYRELGLRKRGGADTRVLRKNMYFPIYINPLDGSVSIEKNKIFNIEVLPQKSDGTDGCWRWGLDTVKLRNKDLVGRPVSGIKWDVFEKDYLETDGELRRIKPKSVFSGTSYSTDRATKEYRSLMQDVDFTSPKGVSFLRDLIEYSVPKDTSDIILDFFAGSGTTAHAVMQLNSEEASAGSAQAGNRKFICVQLPEPTAPDSEAFKAGYKTIAEITKERIRRAGAKIKKEKEGNGVQLTTDHSPFTTDVGFRVFKLDSSNINAWDGDVKNFKQNLLTASENLKPSRSEEDVLYEVLLKTGLDLTQPIEEKTIAGKKVFNIGSGALFVCLANDITTAIAEGIGQWKEELQPVSCRVIFKDTGFDDVEKTNSIQILKQYGVGEVNTI